MGIELATVGGWIFSVITAGIAYKAAVRKHSETTKDSDKSIYVAAVTNERAKWREELRKSVAEFCMLSIESSPNIQKLLQLKIGIILRLNPRANDPAFIERHKFDHEIRESVNTIFAAAKTSNSQVILDQVNKLESSAQELLKQEWEKSKAEALSGKVK
jgi:hypothetical protein